MHTLVEAAKTLVNLCNGGGFTRYSVAILERACDANRFPTLENWKRLSKALNAFSLLLVDGDGSWCPEVEAFYTVMHEWDYLSQPMD